MDAGLSVCYGLLEVKLLVQRIGCQHEYKCRISSAWLEQRPVEAKARGSNPLCGATIALVAQLDRASDYGSEGRGFESLRGHERINR